MERASDGQAMRLESYASAIMICVAHFGFYVTINRVSPSERYVQDVHESDCSRIFTYNNRHASNQSWLMVAFQSRAVALLRSSTLRMSVPSETSTDHT